MRTYTGTQAQTIEYEYHHDGSRSDMSATVGGTIYAGITATMVVAGATR